MSSDFKSLWTGSAVTNIDRSDLNLIWVHYIKSQEAQPVMGWSEGKLKRQESNTHTRIDTDKKDMKRTYWSDNSKHSLEERNYK